MTITAGRDDAFAIRLRPGDFDGDGKTDTTDYAEYLARLTGPHHEPDSEPKDWRWFDYNDDRRVDLADFRLAQNSFTGP